MRIIPSKLTHPSPSFLRVGDGTGVPCCHFLFDFVQHKAAGHFIETTASHWETTQVISIIHNVKDD